MTTLRINGIEIPPANIDEKTKRRFMFLMRKSETDRKQLPALVDMLNCSIRRRNWDETEKIAAKLRELTEVRSAS